MALYIGMTAVTTLLAAFVNNKLTGQGTCISRGRLCNRILLGLIFVSLFLVSALRVEVGNDYGEYLEIFQDIHAGRHVSTEIGFNAVVRAVQFVFGTGVVSGRIIFAIFAFATVLFFLLAIYEQSDSFCLSFFLLLANGYYFSSMTSVRYYFVLAVALYAMKYALQKKWVPFVCLIVFAALFHQSVLLVIPVYFLATIHWKRWHLFMFVLLCGSFLVFRDFYRMIIFHFYPYYENSVFDNGQTSLINILKCLAVLVLCLFYYKEAIREYAENRFYFCLNLGALALYLFCSFIPVLSRVGYYLSVSNLFLVPSVLKRIPKKGQRICFTILVILAYTAYFAMFLYKAYGADVRLLPYQCWLFE